MKKDRILLCFSIIFFAFSCARVSAGGDKKEPIVVAMEDEVDSTPLFKLCDGFIQEKIKAETFESQLAQVLRAGININACNVSGQPVLCHVILTCLGLTIPDEHLFLNGETLVKRNRLKQSCLSLLTILDHYGADIHLSTQKKNYSPLHIAVSIGEQEIIKFLLKSISYKKGGGKALNLVDTKGITPLKLAEDLFCQSIFKHKIVRQNAATAPTPSKKKAFEPAIKRARAIETCYREIKQLFFGAQLDLPVFDFLSKQDLLHSRLLEIIRRRG